jgi:hypothetical protein
MLTPISVSVIFQQPSARPVHQQQVTSALASVILAHVFNFFGVGLIITSPANPSPLESLPSPGTSHRQQLSCCLYAALRTLRGKNPHRLPASHRSAERWQGADGLTHLAVGPWLPFSGGLCDEGSPPTSFAARLADRVTAGTLELGTNFNQFPAASGAGRSRLVLVLLVFVLLHRFAPWLDCVVHDAIQSSRQVSKHINSKEFKIPLVHLREDLAEKRTA